MEPIIKLVTHPHPLETLQARTDEAIVTGRPLVEFPYWFENTETGQLYHAIYGCIGWPAEISESDEEQPGYIAIIGVVRPTKTLEHYNPIDANFQLLAEDQSKDVSVLISKAVELRETYGFGVQPDLLRVWYGDPDRFLTTLALRNERLIMEGGEKHAVLISPAVDMYQKAVFDNYLRSLKSCLLKENLRFYFGGNDILKNSLMEFRRGNPAVFAAGGMVHTLLNNTTWLGNVEDGIFSVEGEE